LTTPDVRLLRPRRIDAYEGSAFAAWFVAIYNVVGTARSLIHVFAPDSGAGTIAGIDTRPSADAASPGERLPPTTRVRAMARCCSLVDTVIVSMDWRLTVSLNSSP
jgi:hypothetical protein